MKFSGAILLMFLVIASCRKSNERLMQEKIEENYSTKANEALFEDYNPVSFGTIDTIYSSLKTDSSYVKLIELSYKISLKINEIVFRRNKGTESQRNADRKLQLLFARLDRVNTDKENIKQKFKKSVIGYRMKHTFSIKNKVADKTIQPTISVIFYDNLLIKDIVVLKE